MIDEEGSRGRHTEIGKRGEGWEGYGMGRRLRERIEGKIDREGHIGTEIEQEKGGGRKS